MTVSVQDPIKKYFGNGSAVSFTYPYLLLDQADLKVYLNGVLASGYTVTGIGNGGGGAVIFPSPPASGTLVILQRLVVLNRETDYQEAAAIPTDTLDRDFDRAWLAIQDTRAAAPLTLNGLGELDATTKRIINLADPINAQDAVTKAWAETAGTAQVALAAAQAVIASNAANVASASSAAASSSQSAAAASATIANAAVATVGVSETNAAASAVAAASSQTGAAGSAAQAVTQAGLADASKVAAGVSEVNAATSATNANTSKVAAGVSETNASASAVNAAASATAAAASAASIAGGPVASIAGLTGAVTSAALKTATALNLVNNTADLSKPISTATQAAINALAVATTGDFKFVMRATAPTGWVAGDGSTIGNVGSGATRANVDTQALFTAWWTDYTNAQLPILTSTGTASTRGASAAADWTAGKRLTVFDVRERFIRSSGTVVINGTKYAESVGPHTHPISPMVALPGTGGGSGFTYNQVSTGSPLGAGNTGSPAGTETAPVHIAMLGCFKL
ncbi:hypothetical protein CY658_21760 [Variovorax sp. RO1]|uniref:phage tail fiber domain-containing protein n=1 Tax=Variovorax sp. RO1 TaxID=2066034 RepID=UPI000C716BAC|nr:phage tail fiber protein [Variovorax sp. RO1]PLC03445.1 hypothetical protein CY658_21760 [Variovorax sp. RO1]